MQLLFLLNGFVWGAATDNRAACFDGADQVLNGDTLRIGHCHDALN